VTGFDVVVLSIAGGSLVVGIVRGLASELVALAAWVIAFLVARAVAPAAGTWLGQWLSDPVARYAAAFALAFVAVLVSMSFVRLALRRLIHAAGLSPADRFLGALFGLARATAPVLALVLAAGLTSFPRQDWWRNAWLAPPLETAVLMARPWLPARLANRLRYRQPGASPGAGKVGV